jgi:hypothetical protein
MKKGENFLTWKAELAGIDRVKSRCEIVLNILTLKAEQARTDRVKIRSEEGSKHSHLKGRAGQNWQS